MTGVDQSTEMLAAGRARVERAGLAARIELREGRAEALPFADGEFDALTFTYLLRYVDDPGATMRELARVVRPGGTVAMLEFGLPRGIWRPLWELYVRIGLPRRGRARLAGVARRRPLPRAEHPRLLRALPARGGARLWRDAGLRDVQARRLEPRRRRRRVGRARVSSGARPAFYALAPGGWRDYVTLLHPPYTLWHLSYVAIGAALAPQMKWGLLGWTTLAFLLAMGVGAHALDELNGRPLRTQIPAPFLVALAVVSIAAACAIGLVVAAGTTWWLSPSSPSARSSSWPTTSSSSAARSIPTSGSPRCGARFPC